MSYEGQDFYCDVALKGEIPLEKEYESEKVLAFRHTRPFWPVHIVVVPKKHVPSFTNFAPEDQPYIDEVIRVVQDLARKVEAETGAARVLTNLGKYQDSKHLHFHINSGDPLR